MGKVIIYTGHGELIGGDVHHAFDLVTELDANEGEVELFTDHNKLFVERAEAWLKADVPIKYLDTRPRLFSPHFMENYHSKLDQQKENLSGFNRLIYTALSLPIGSRKCYDYLKIFARILSFKYLRDHIANILVFFNLFRQEKRDVDVFHFNNGGYPAKVAGIFSILMARCFGVRRIVMTVHNIPRFRIFPIDFLCDLIVRNCCSQVITSSERVRQEMIARRTIPREMIKTIHCGMEDIPLLSMAECVAKRESMGITPDRLSLLISGNYEEERKGHIPLLHALALVKKKFPEVLLMIAGSGSESRKKVLESVILQNELSKNVQILGYRKDLYEINSIADICLTPSTGVESLPYTIIEAARLAKPVITTTMGGCSEAVEDGVTGYVVEPGNLPMLAEKLETLLASQSLRERMGQAARELFIDRFLLKNRIAEHLAIYNGELRDS